MSRARIPLLFCLLALTACGASPAPSSPASAPGAPAPPVPVRVEVLSAAPLERAIEGTGALAAIDSAVLRPEIQGLVEAVLFQDGQAVKKGQALVRLRSADARAALLDAEARATLSELELARKVALVARGDAAKADQDRAEAEAALAKAALIRAQEALRKTTIAAPFDGIVGLREVAVGELVDPSRRITRLESLDNLVVDLALAETALGSLAPGQPATVAVDALPGVSFDGQVSYVAPRINDGSRTVDVRVALQDPAGLLRPGMSAEARIVTARVPDAVLIPTESVVRAGGGMAAYVIDPEGKAELRPIRPGERGETRLEVLDGLAVGERVVVEGLARLRPGAMVQVLETEPTADPAAAPAVKP